MHELFELLERALKKFGIAIAIKMPMIRVTIKTSTIVKALVVRFVFMSKPIIQWYPA